MIVNGLSRIVSIILIPDQISNKLIGKYTLRVHNEQCKNVKLFYCKSNFLIAYSYKTVFQTKV